MFLLAFCLGVTPRGVKYLSWLCAQEVSLEMQGPKWDAEEETQGLAMCKANDLPFLYFETRYTGKHCFIMLFST